MNIQTTSPLLSHYIIGLSATTSLASSPEVVQSRGLRKRTINILQDSPHGFDRATQQKIEILQKELENIQYQRIVSLSSPSQYESAEVKTISTPEEGEIETLISKKHLQLVTKQNDGSTLGIIKKPLPSVRKQGVLKEVKETEEEADTVNEETLITHCHLTEEGNIQPRSTTTILSSLGTVITCEQRPHMTSNSMNGNASLYIIKDVVNPNKGHYHIQGFFWDSYFIPRKIPREYVDELLACNLIEPHSMQKRDGSDLVPPQETSDSISCPPVRPREEYMYKETKSGNMKYIKYNDIKAKTIGDDKSIKKQENKEKREERKQKLKSYVKTKTSPLQEAVRAKLQILQRPLLQAEKHVVSRIERIRNKEEAERLKTALQELEMLDFMEVENQRRKEEDYRTKVRLQERMARAEKKINELKELVIEQMMYEMTEAKAKLEEQQVEIEILSQQQKEQEERLDSIHKIRIIKRALLQSKINSLEEDITTKTKLLTVSQKEKEQAFGPLLESTLTKKEIKQRVEEDECFTRDVQELRTLLYQCLEEEEEAERRKEAKEQQAFQALVDDYLEYHPDVAQKQSKLKAKIEKIEKEIQALPPAGYITEKSKLESKMLGYKVKLSRLSFTIEQAIRVIES